MDESNAAGANASEMDCKVEPTENHEWLQQLVGEWTCEAETLMGPDQPPMKSGGYENVRPLGQVWIIGEGGMEMPGGGEMGHTRLTLGFDPAKDRFVGSWIGSMMASLWIYEGQLDEARKVLTLDCQGPSFTDPTKLASYQDIVELPGDGTRILRSRVKGNDGQWFEFMKAVYRRKG